MGSTGEDVIISHPYNPTDMKLPGFAPNQLSWSAVVGPYLLASCLSVLVTWIASGFIKKISKLERILMCWWIFNGLNHIVLEGYFLITPEFYKDNFYLSELWKEYCKGDSRFARGDSIVVSVERVLVTLVGFPSVLAMYAIATKKSYRYLLQLVLSVEHLFAFIVYFMTAVLDGDNFAISPFHYYTYYIFPNSVWIVVPTSISIYSWKKMNAAVQAQDEELHKVKRR